MLFFLDVSPKNLWFGYIGALVWSTSSCVHPALIYFVEWDSLIFKLQTARYSTPRPNFISIHIPWEYGKNLSDDEYEVNPHEAFMTSALLWWLFGLETSAQWTRRTDPLVTDEQVECEKITGCKVETPIHDSIKELVAWECKEHEVKSWMC